MLGLTYQTLNTFTQITKTNLKFDEARKFTPIPSNIFPQTNSMSTNLQPPHWIPYFIATNFFQIAYLSIAKCHSHLPIKDWLKDTKP